MASAHIPMWNIDAPVGKNKTNRPDDVRLVQSMLIAAIASSARGPILMPGLRLQASGVFNELTENLIKVFQEMMNRKYPGKYPPDGVVTPLHSPEHVDWLVRSPNGKNSTMAALNFELRAISKETHQNIGAKLAERVP